jgi:Flp pilus assembly protein TadB
MLGSILSMIQGLMARARDVYGVNPVIFIVLYFGSAPVWYYSLYRTLRAVARKGGNEIMLWSAIFLASTVAPFLYVVLFGHNLPWWVYAVIAVLVGQGVVSLVLKMRKGREGSTPSSAA